MRSNFRNKFKFKGSSCLNGREVSIDKVLIPQSVKDYIELEGEDGRERIIKTWIVGLNFRWADFLYRKENLDIDICTNKVSMWAEALIHGFESYKNDVSLVYLIEDLDTFLASTGEKHPKQIKLA
ncbi:MULTISPECIES: hypothetical protein, partial [unclassified Shewanella]|uniref:hypothetical protein n=1 Tax=unclassified Shewanella TaxID=196818 RepID=UPI00354C61DF